MDGDDMKRSLFYDISHIVVGVLTVMMLTVAILNSCGPSSSPMPVRPPLSFAPSATMPAVKTANDWVNLNILMATAQAKIDQANADAQAARDEAKAANTKTWSFFHAAAYTLGIIGIGIMVLCVLPWTKAFAAPYAQSAGVFIGCAIACGAMPYLLTSAMPILQYAGYGVASIVALWVLGLAYLSLRAKWNTIRMLNYKAESTDDPNERLKHAAASVAIQRTINPKLNKAFATGKLQLSTEGQVIQAPPTT